MRNRWVGLCFAALVSATVGVGIARAECSYADALRLHWAHSRKMLTAIAAAMPEEKLDYRPTKEVRSFREMLLHLVQDGTMHMGTVAGTSEEELGKIEAKYGNLQTREQLLRALDDFYDYGDQVLAGVTDSNAMDLVADMETKEERTRIEAALTAFEDQMDHYGNFVVYLRLNGIVPPATAEAHKMQNSK